MRRAFSMWLMFGAAAIFAGAAFAQFTITQVIHEPTATDVGPVIAVMAPTGIFVPPASAPGNPLPPAGTAPNNVYGNGRPFHNELPRVSAEFYAMGGRTTHDLAFMRNASGADIIVDTTTIAIVITPAKDVKTKPEGANPGLIAQVFFGTATTVAIPNGAELALFLLVTKWLPTVDTSPRDYNMAITMTNTVTGTPITANGMMTVPEVGGSEGSGCVSDGNGSTGGLILLALGGMLAIVPPIVRLRRKRVVVQ